MGLQFGEFTFDRATRQLRRGGEDVHLPPKAFELLDLLLTDRPRVVSKAQIRDRLWPATFVSESTMATAVSDLRKALGDDAEQPRFLRTVHRVGYAFCGEVRVLSGPGRQGVPAASFRLLLEDREVPLREGENIIGRVDDAVLWLDSKGVSRRHARIIVGAGSAMIEDLGSKNGTFVAGRRISAVVPLSDGDDIRLGQVTILFRSLQHSVEIAHERAGHDYRYAVFRDEPGVAAAMFANQVDGLAG